MRKRVLVALDDSIRATGVLAAGVECAEKWNAELYLVRAVTVPRELAGADVLPTESSMLPRLAEAAKEELSLLAKRHEHVNVKEFLVAVGQPAQTIVAMADAIGADVIVVGSRGYRGRDRVLGTTAASVANLATRNVLIVHEQKH